ncbi:MAG: hypothetical protein ACRD2H_15290, partial [Terriglobales bacterium]
GKQSEAEGSRAAQRTRKRSAAERQVMPRVSKPGCPTTKPCAAYRRALVFTALARSVVAIS